MMEMQRFARGDKARSTKGSGLGLAIAQTYTDAVGGAFHIEIDDEQFIAVVEIPKRQSEQIVPQELREDGINLIRVIGLLFFLVFIFIYIMGIIIKDRSVQPCYLRMYPADCF